MEELREAFDQFGWLLSAAVPAPKSRVDAGYDVKKISKVLDFINVMTYDLHGSWDGFAGNFQFWMYKSRLIFSKFKIFFETDIMKENSEKFGWSFTLKIVFDVFWRSIWKAVKFLGLEYILFLNFFIFTDHHAPLFKREHDYYPYNTLTVDYAMQYWHQKGT